MNDSEKNTLIIGLLSLSLILLMYSTTGELEPIDSFNNTNGSGMTLLNDSFYVDDINAGPMDFESAEYYCNSRGMELPTREQAWEMWRASANCKIAMVLNNHVIKDKATFLKSCHNLNKDCLFPSKQVNYFCNPNSDLLFLDEKVFRYGNYWLKDKYDKNGHYSANFINGMTNAYADNIKLLGVRCVRSVSQKVNKE